MVIVRPNAAYGNLFRFQQCPTKKGGEHAPRPVHVVKPAGSESAGAVGGARASRAIVAYDTGTQIRAAAAAVAAGGDVEQCSRIVVRIAAVINRTAVHAIDAGDQRRRDAGAAEHEPAGTARTCRPVDGNAGIWI